MKKFSEQNDMIPLTLASGTIQQLHSCKNANQLECMLVALACPVIRVKRHRSGSIFYKGGCINFLQDLNSLVTKLPRSHRNTPYFVIVKRGSEGEVIHEARVRRHIVLSLIIWLRDNNPLYRNIQLDTAALNELPEDGRYEGVIVNSIDENDVEAAQANDEAVNDSYGSMISTVPLPQNTGLERDSV